MVSSLSGPALTGHGVCLHHQLPLCQRRQAATIIEDQAFPGVARTPSAAFVVTELPMLISCLPLHG